MELLGIYDYGLALNHIFFNAIFVIQRTHYDTFNIVNVQKHIL